MNEVWLPIPAHHGYEASSEGRIKNAVTGRVLKPWTIKSTGRLQVDLGKGVRRLVNRLVCAAFHGLCPEGLECRHLNGQRRDNRPDNLCWGTKLENAADRFGHGTMDPHYLTMKGETLCIAEWSRRTGMPTNTIANRKRRGWSDERTLTEPVHWNPFKGPKNPVNQEFCGRASDGQCGSL